MNQPTRLLVVGQGYVGLPLAIRADERDRDADAITVATEDELDVGPRMGRSPVQDL